MSMEEKENMAGKYMFYLRKGDPQSATMWLFSILEKELRLSDVEKENYAPWLAICQRGILGSDFSDLASKNIGGETLVKTYVTNELNEYTAIANPVEWNAFGAVPAPWLTW